MILNREKLQHGLFDTPTLHAPDKDIEVVAKNILTILEYEPLTNYHSMKEADQWLVAKYWVEIDGFQPFKQVTPIKSEPLSRSDFVDWIRHKGTNPEAITRARRWLANPKQGYILMDEFVVQKAQLAASRYAKSRGG